MQSIKLTELVYHHQRITHLQSAANYTFVYFVDQPRLLLSSTLSSCQGKLPGFIRIHRKYAINPVFAGDIQLRLGQPQIVLHTHWLPVSRRLLKDVRQSLAKPGTVLLYPEVPQSVSSIDYQITHEPYRDISLTWK